jgi:hypothetical protein
LLPDKENKYNVELKISIRNTEEICSEFLLVLAPLEFGIDECLTILVKVSDT